VSPKGDTSRLYLFLKAKEKKIMDEDMVLISGTRDEFEALLDVIEFNSVTGVSNINGADKYVCNACNARQEIMGYCSSTGHFDEVVHKDDCALSIIRIKLRKALGLDD